MLTKEEALIVADAAATYPKDAGYAYGAYTKSNGQVVLFTLGQMLRLIRKNPRVATLYG
jgi:hypothetical protein